jgi:hypothetical protein
MTRTLSSYDTSCFPLPDNLPFRAELGDCRGEKEGNMVHCQTVKGLMLQWTESLMVGKHCLFFPWELQSFNKLPRKKSVFPTAS